MEIVRILPKAWLSFLTGKLASIELPSFLAVPLLHWFVRRYKLDTSLMEKDLHNYRSIGDLFTRRLRAGVRPIEKEPVYPVDGTVRTGGLIEDEFLEQIKGIRYPLADLLGSEVEAARFKGGTYLNMYLSPKDYHRIHSPVTGTIRKMSYIPGALWPVNDWSVRAIRDLFAINERIITYLSTPDGEVGVVMVGATNVGKMSLSYDSIVTNQSPWRTKSVAHTEYVEGKKLHAGDDLGVFHLGSSVVLLMDNQYASTHGVKALKEGAILFGQTIE